MSNLTFGIAMAAIAVASVLLNFSFMARIENYKKTIRNLCAWINRKRDDEQA